MKKNSTFNIHQELTDEQKRNINYLDSIISFISGFLVFFSIYYTAKCTCSTNQKELVALGVIFAIHILFLLLSVLRKLHEKIMRTKLKSLVVFIILSVVASQIVVPVAHLLPESIIPGGPPWVWGLVLLFYFIIFSLTEYKKDWGYLNLIGAKKYLTIFILPTAGFLIALAIGETKIVHENFNSYYCESFDCKSMCNLKSKPTCLKHLPDNNSLQPKELQEESK